MPENVNVELPDGWLKPGDAEWLKGSGIPYGTGGISVPAGSPATKMEPGLVAKLIELKLLTNWGTPGKVGYTSPDYYLVSTDPKGTYHVESMLATGWSKDEVLEKIAEAAAPYAESTDGAQVTRVNIAVDKHRAEVDAWPYAQTPGGGKPGKGSPVATPEQLAAAQFPGSTTTASSGGSQAVKLETMIELSEELALTLETILNNHKLTKAKLIKSVRDAVAAFRGAA